MKYGFMWFLRLDIPVQIARILVIPCFVWGFFATIRSIFFVIAWGLFAISLLITLCTFFMHIPSTEKVEKTISQHEKDFLEKQKTEFRTHRSIEILELKCFAANHRLRLSRRINKRKVYDTLVMLAWVKTNDGLWLVCDEKPLWRDAPAERRCYEIKNPAEVQIKKETDTDDELKWCLKVGEDSFRVSCKNDYHFRDFTSKYNIKIVEL